MTLFFASMRTTLIRVCRDRAFVAVILLLPLALLGCSRLLAKGAPITVIRAGVVFDAGDSVAAKVFDSLPQSPSMVFEAFGPGELDAVEHQVKTGRLECAYLLDEALAQAVESGDLTAGVKLLRSPGSVADTIFNEVFFAAVLRETAPAVTTEQIIRLFGGEAGEIDGWVRERMDWYGEQGMFVSPQSETAGIVPVPTQPRASPIAVRVLHGIAALFLIALTVFCLPRFVAEKKGGLWRRLGFGGALRYYGGLWVALTILNLLAGGTGLFVIGRVFPAGLVSLSREIGMLAAFSATLCMFAVLCVLMLPSADVLYGGGIFLLLITGVFGGVLFDWREISPSIAGWCRLLITTPYVSGLLSEGAGSALTLLSVCGVAALLSIVRLGSFGGFGVRFWDGK